MPVPGNRRSSRPQGVRPLVLPARVTERAGRLTEKMPHGCLHGWFDIVGCGFYYLPLLFTGVEDMPTYEYECLRCDHQFEVFQGIKDKPKSRCPKCRGKIRRKLGIGGGLLFKGSGFYTTDYRSEGYHKAAKADSPPKAEAPKPAATEPAKKAPAAKKES